MAAGRPSRHQPSGFDRRANTAHGRAPARREAVRHASEPSRPPNPDLGGDGTLLCVHGARERRLAAVMPRRCRTRPRGGGRARRRSCRTATFGGPGSEQLLQPLRPGAGGSAAPGRERPGHAEQRRADGRRPRSGRERGSWSLRRVSGFLFLYDLQFGTHCGELGQQVVVAALQVVDALDGRGAFGRQRRDHQGGYGPDVLAGHAGRGEGGTGRAR